MQEKLFFDTIINSLEETKIFFKRQKSAPTIALMGPSKSAKSTLITELLRSESNMLLSENIGETAQTTLVQLMLMLNSRLQEDEVIIRCIQRKKSLFMDFFYILKSEICKELYEQREELDDFNISINTIKQILNPTNRSYHIFEFSRKYDYLQNLTNILEEICLHIINEPESLIEESDRQFKEQRKKTPTIKKKKIFEQVVDTRFSSNQTNIDKLKNWFEKVEFKISEELNDIWSYPEENILLGKISTDSSIRTLIDYIYNPSSACSLIFEELQYIAAPSDDLKQTYEKEFSTHHGRIVKINILDTVGLTQSSEERDDINDAMDKILNCKFDALLFLCAADERPSVYTNCLTLLSDKQNKLKSVPVIICRTKADIVLRNIMMKKWRKDTGTNIIPNDSVLYNEYVKDAYSTFISEFIESNEYNENSIGKSIKGQTVEYISLAPDLSSKFNDILDGKLNSNHAYEILLKLNRQIDSIYANGQSRPWLQSIDLQHYPLNVSLSIQPLLKTISLALITMNHKQGNQYRKYINSKECFHGNSVNTFRYKISWGEGHETVANVYGNFKLFITNMVRKWLNEVIPFNDILNNVSISYKYLEQSNSNYYKVLHEFPNQFIELIKINWSSIINSISKQLAYDCIMNEFERIFMLYSWDTALRKSLELFDLKFNSLDYWSENISKLFYKELNALLQKMYIFDM